MKFEEWLVSEGLSPSTVKKYAGAIDGPLTKWGLEHNITAKPLRKVIDREEFDELSELIEATEIFGERNLRGKHMYGAALKNYSRYLTFIGDTSSDETATGQSNEQLVWPETKNANYPPFEPKDQKDGRERVLRDVVRRQGQPQFRASLIAAYEGRCAITNCSVLVTLEGYAALDGKGVFQPTAIALRVSRPALAQQWAIFKDHLAESP